LSQAGECHFILCGGIGLANRRDDPTSVFFNFAQPLPLGYLEPEAARRVITEPLEQMEISLENRDKLLAEILNLTSGHPNLTQYVGNALVRTIGTRQERRILRRDLENVQASSSFANEYLKIIWGAANPLEKLITLLLPSTGDRIEQIKQVLEKHDVILSDQELDIALKTLCIYSILEKRELTYSFVPRAFHNILHRSQEVKRLIDQGKHDLKKEVK
jgi:hypothetical protein